MTDLTWQQLQTAIGTAGAISLTGGRVIIDPALITGDSYEALSAEGVIEFSQKLLAACYKAQTEFNKTATAGNRLNSFALPIAGSIVQDADGARLTLTRQVTSVSQIDQDNPSGITN